MAVDRMKLSLLIIVTFLESSLDLQFLLLVVQVSLIDHVLRIYCMVCILTHLYLKQYLFSCQCLLVESFS